MDYFIEIYVNVLTLSLPVPAYKTGDVTKQPIRFSYYDVSKLSKNNDILLVVYINLMLWYLVYQRGLGKQVWAVLE